MKYGRRPQFFFENGRRPYIFLKMEVNLKFFEHGRRPQHFLKMEDNLNFFKMEDDLNVFENVRQPTNFNRKPQPKTMVVSPLQVT